MREGTAGRLRRAVGQRPDGEATAVLVHAEGPAGPWSAAAGVADVTTGEPARHEHRFRIGGVTKTFLAATVLAMAEDGLLDLDEPVDRQLPGLLRAPVTTRQLLDHTSGLADESDVRYNDTPWFLRHRLDTFTPEQLLARPLRQPLDFAPGTAQQITRANYVVVGLLVERVGGRGYAKEIEERVLRPLGLDATTLPGTDPALPAPHLRGYEDGLDITEHSPTIHGAAGEMISTVPDLDRFLTALLGGELLGEQALAQMFRVPDVPYVKGGPAFCGAGLDSMVLPGGTTVWGMAGVVHGYLAGIGATRGLGHRVVYMMAPRTRGTLRVPPAVQSILAAAF
ncbi:serine hydrolase domain-containing protein [Streptomyces griseorubiginosus]|uniref:serine hydrolase domain-containing protein n=1 Tax=Streptomyces griseorubiginosus TaxID=67304 RepID=UPI002E817C2D|nr:serine hydrolase domain-containing protein [Streptomyces griseorubiginosus]WUB45407.1 beta-lactamase family protein [Streptomyces griseorubiginosus]WUB53925.1 beta-lactamase family protein [Streptomyces griseorubiginosus]